jgi:hypothetical protein
MSDEVVVGKPLGDNFGGEVVSREESQAELPLDWDDLMDEVLRRGDGRCAICGLFVCVLRVDVATSVTENLVLIVGEANDNPNSRDSILSSALTLYE